MVFKGHSHPLAQGVSSVQFLLFPLVETRTEYLAPSLLLPSSTLGVRPAGRSVGEMDHFIKEAMHNLTIFHRRPPARARCGCCGT